MYRFAILTHYIKDFGTGLQLQSAIPQVRKSTVGEIKDKEGKKDDETIQKINIMTLSLQYNQFSFCESSSIGMI